MSEEQTRKKRIEYFGKLLIKSRERIKLGKLKLHKEILLFSRVYTGSSGGGLDQDYGRGEEYFYFQPNGSIRSIKYEPACVGCTESLDFHSFISRTRNSLLRHIELNTRRDPIRRLEKLLGIQGE